MSKEVKERFVRIAGKYDFMNHFLSMNLDIRWREEAAKEAMLDKKSFTVLDSATGTGDLAFAVYDTARRMKKKVRITGTDFVQEMLDVGVAKAKESGRGSIKFKIGDSLRTGFGNSSFDVITTGFSLRNFDSVERFLRESHRILKKGGRLVILEMAKPEDSTELLKFQIYSYFIRFVSLFADRAYSWLVDSINEFDKQALVCQARKTGFRRIKLKSLPSGVAYLLVAEK